MPLASVRSLDSDFQPYGPGSLRPRRVSFDPADPAFLSRDVAGRLRFRLLAPADTVEAMVVVRTDGVSGHVMSGVGAAGSVSLWQALVEPEHATLACSIALRLDGGEAVYLTPTGIANGIERIDRFAVDTDAVRFPDTPAWTQGAVIYQIFPDRFARSGEVRGELAPWGAAPTRRGRLGGSLRGIRDKIPYLSDLGVDVVYLNPIFVSPSNHRYDTIDYRNVDPGLGGNDALGELVQGLHAAGMRIILDVSLNHCHPRFFAFADVVTRGVDSVYAGWFDIREWPVRVRVRPHLLPDDSYWRTTHQERLELESGVPMEVVGGEGRPVEPTYGAWYGVPLMPRVDLAHPEARRYMLDVATYWIREFDVDGWRMDVVRYVDHDFWAEFRREIRSIKPDAYLLAEVMGDARRWLRGDEFDGVMNYSFRDLVVDYVARGSITAETFCEGLLELSAMYAPDATAASQNLVGSHDTPRFLTVANGDRTALLLATLLQMTLPGAPGIYYGDEVGMEGGPDPDNRRGMAWEGVGDDISTSVRSLIAVRRRHHALRHGAWRLLRGGGDAVVYERSLGSVRNVIVVNTGEAEERVSGLRVASVLWRCGDVSVESDVVRVGPRAGAVLA